MEVNRWSAIRIFYNINVDISILNYKTIRKTKLENPGTIPAASDECPYWMDSDECHRSWGLRWRPSLSLPPPIQCYHHHSTPPPLTLQPQWTSLSFRWVSSSAGVRALFTHGVVCDGVYVYSDIVWIGGRTRWIDRRSRQTKGANAADNDRIQNHPAK